MRVWVLATRTRANLYIGRRLDTPNSDTVSLLPDYLVGKLSTGTRSKPVQLAPRHQKTYDHAYFPRHHEPIDSADIKRPD